MKLIFNNKYIRTSNRQVNQFNKYRLHSNSLSSILLSLLKSFQTSVLDSAQRAKQNAKHNELRA